MRRLIIAFFLLAGSIGQAADVELLQSTIVDNNALNFSSSSANFNRNINGRTYQRFPMATSRGYQYATYYDENRNVALGRRKLPDGAWEVIRFTDYNITSSDSHNVVTVGICEKDGTIHLAFDHHADALNYRVSEIGVATNPESVVWSKDLFGAVTDRLGSVGRITGLTYPSFFNAPNGNLMLYYRSGGSGNGDGMIQEYNGTLNDWTTGLGKFISRNGTYNGTVSNNSTSRCPYINGISYGGTRLHASWGWRESSAGSSNNHDLNYAYSDDNGRTWYNNAGVLIGTTGSASVISIDSPGLIAAPIPQNIGLSNQYTHYAFADGSCHVMVAHSGDYQHYWRNTAGVWNNAALNFGGSRPKITGDDDGNLFLVYTSGGKPRIAKGVPNAAKTAWSWSSVYTQNVSEGGEGQLDYSRWEADRVLSIYGQEQPSNTAETPSSLHVFDYKVSTKAILPIPANEAVMQSLDAALEWTAGLDANTHRIYFGTNEQDVATATTSSPEYQGQQSSTAFSPSPVPSEWGTYYWRVDEVQVDSSVVQGLIWRFTLAPADIGLVTQVVDQGIWDVASTWDPAGVPRVGRDYETSMQLRTLTTSATFAGDSLTILTDGELALRNTGANTAVVPNLLLAGGNIRAGTLNNVTSVLAGNISVLADANLVGYGNATGPRNLRISSMISGDSTLHSTGTSAYPHTCTIDNPTNAFSGVWQSSVGTLLFENAGAVGAADIEVLDQGKLQILGDWISASTLTVADSTTVSVAMGAYDWTVFSLEFGGVSIADGYYTSDQLNALGVNAVFSGSGTLTVQAVLAFDDILFSQASDASVKENNDVVDLTKATTLLGAGGSNPWVDRATVYVFQLPDFGAVDNPFVDATFTFNYEAKQSTLKDNDLYGLGRRSSSTVLGSDYYGQTATPDPTDATRLQPSILVNGTAVGAITTSASGSDALLDYLNTQYASGAGAGEYVFLRLNTAGAKSGIARATLTMSEGGVAGPPVTRPQLSYQAQIGAYPQPILEYGILGGDIVFSWTGSGFKVQSRTNLTEGIWMDVPGGDVSPVNVVPTNTEDFFRLIEQ